MMLSKLLWAWRNFFYFSRRKKGFVFLKMVSLKVSDLVVFHRETYVKTCFVMVDNFIPLYRKLSFGDVFSLKSISLLVSRRFPRKGIWFPHRFHPDCVLHLINTLIGKSGGSKRDHNGR